MQEALANRDYKIEWNPDAKKISFGIEKIISLWHDNMRWIGDEYELVSDTFSAYWDIGQKNPELHEARMFVILKLYMSFAILC